MPTQASSEALSTQCYDMIVVGAGVVGSALASALARSGRRVALLERDLSHPDRIVGELLQPGGVMALSMLGLQDALRDIDAIPVEGYQVFYGPRSVPIPYPAQAGALAYDKGKHIESASGKVEGRSFHHGNFVQALRTLASAQQNVTLIEATVRDLVADGNKIVGVSATRKLPQHSPEEVREAGANSDEALELRASITIVADGCFSKFRRQFGSSIAPIVRSNFVGLELEHAPLPAPKHGHVVLAPSGPILLYQISSTMTRILIDVPGEKLPSAAKGELQKHIRDNVVPYLPDTPSHAVDRPQQAKPSAPTPLGANLLAELDAQKQRLRSMPNSFLPPSMQGQRSDRKGVIVVGDAMNMRHPLTGGGMSVGLWDVVHLTNALGGGKWPPSEGDAVSTTQAAVIKLDQWDAQVRPALRAWHWNRKGLASVINILAQALYSLFGADDENLEVLREGCFKYFELGGECVGGPVRLLSGLAPQPLLLVYHFFSVALYSIWCLFTNERTAANGSKAKPSLLEYPALLVKSAVVFYTACVVLLPVIFTELRSNVPKFTSHPSTFSPSASSSSSPYSKGKSDKLNDFASALGDRTTLLLLSAVVVLAWVYMGHQHGAVTSTGSGISGGGFGFSFGGSHASQIMHGVKKGVASRGRGALEDWFTFPRALARVRG
ncbi:SE-domain-containing protein [Tilletiaria anomala UBC 951]|uniref:squalene monooxygenase n=1 Tax=Tilletiaria anomala (strain ATCC 24038 / CBS 436.72 / UBC 951) TaxID=1037660 RepID=A0A066WPZ7_TILAU|nr:SE-domain-containing protein [Tilletiaria anomala UBC 951]KDN52700.1 SE-domain-containing protein [Tilletiaria anomala UBC 951]